MHNSATLDNAKPDSVTQESVIFSINLGNVTLCNLTLDSMTLDSCDTGRMKLDSVTLGLWLVWHKKVLLWI